MKEFPRRLHHGTPGWVKNGALFHIRVRVAPKQPIPLVDPDLGSELLCAAKRYHESARWWCELFLLMPDHWHALLSFPPEAGMSRTLRDWKRGTTRFQNIKWQENYFDHRIRNPKEREETWHYTRRNPTAKGLVAKEDDWPCWWSGTLGASGAH
jgi:putative transposase